MKRKGLVNMWEELCVESSCHEQKSLRGAHDIHLHTKHTHVHGSTSQTTNMSKATHLSSISSFLIA